MRQTLNTNSKTARLAAAQFFFLGMPLSLWGQSYVMSRIFVRQNPAATANNLLSNEFIFRLSILSHLADTAIFVLMMLLFYQLFRPVDKHLSKLMLVPALAQLAVVFIFEVFNFTALMILKSDTRPALDLIHQQEAAYFLLRMHALGSGIGMGKLFIGLCFIPFALLVFKSGFAPRIIGVLLVIGGVGYIADCCTAILLQRADYLMLRSFLMYTTVAYILALLWFLVKGVREPTAMVIRSN